MTKIGLLNIQQVDNYGANLIAYAMQQQVLDIIGTSNSVEIIDYRPDYTQSYLQSQKIKHLYLQYGLLYALKKVFLKVKRAIINAVRSVEILNEARSIFKSIYKKDDSEETYIDENAQMQRLARFEEFRQAYLNRTSICKAEDIPDLRFDAIIVGSDVVWKPQRLLSPEGNLVYFLHFPTTAKRIAYAASLGISDKAAMKRMRTRYQAAIEPFDFISIRESSGTKYVQSLFPNRTIYHCIDPVFLRGEDEYCCMQTKMDYNEAFIYAYILGDNADAYKYVENLAREKNLKVLYHVNRNVSGLDGDSTYSDGPAEFLSRVYNAKYIVTDSFHGTAFSIIFRKQFFAFTRGILSVRLENFLTQIGLASRLLKTVHEDTNIDETIPYDDVWKVLDIWIEESKNYLRKALFMEEIYENNCDHAYKTK